MPQQRCRAGNRNARAAACHGDPGDLHPSLWLRQVESTGLSRSGILEAQVEAVIVKTLESTPPHATHWSTRSMATASGLSVMAISRIWRAFGLQPHRTETLKLSPDPLLIDKVLDIVGLYMNPPEHALVFRVDEKSQI